MALPPIVWYASSRTPDGYGDEARAFLGAMEGVGMSPALADYSNWSVAQAGISNQEEQRLTRQEGRAGSVDPLAAVNVHHYVPGKPLEKLCRDSGFNVSRSMFETDRIPFSWLPSLSLMDEIWVPTQFNVESFAYSGVSEDKLRILGGTLDFDFYDPDRSDLEPLSVPGVPEGSFVFLSNFDFSERKGWQCLLTAWEQAFAPHDPVCLVLKTASLSSSASEIEERIGAFWGSRKDAAAPVVVLNEMLERKEMAELYKAADAFVLPSRGEGWGRPYMEALAMGLPTIASDFSAHLEFVKPEYAWLTGGRLVPVPQGLNLANGLYDGHRWFDVDPEELRDALREVASNPAESVRKAGPARQALMERFSPEVIAGRIEHLTRGLMDRRGAFPLREPGRMAVRARTGRKGTAAQALALQGRLEVLSGRRYRLTNQPFAPGLDEVSGIAFSWQEDAFSDSYAVLLEDGGSDAGELSKLAGNCIDLLLTRSPDRARQLVAAGLPPGRVKSIGSIDWSRSVSHGFSKTAERLGSILADSGLAAAPPLSHLDRLPLEGRRQKALWTPDLRDDQWRGALDAWGASDMCKQATLVMWLGASGVEESEALETLGAASEGLEGSDLLLLEADFDSLPAAALTCDYFISAGAASSISSILGRFAEPLQLAGK